MKAVILTGYDQNGRALERISEIFGQNHLEPSVDSVYALDDVNDARKKVASVGSEGKAILKNRNSSIARLDRHLFERRRYREYAHSARWR